MEIKMTNTSDSMFGKVKFFQLLEASLILLWGLKIIYLILMLHIKEVMFGLLFNNKNYCFQF